MKMPAQPAPTLATRPLRRLLASLMIAMLFARPLLTLAEEPSAPIHGTPAHAMGEGQPQLLRIDILDGEGALNNIRQRTAREPIVEVKDENHKPVAGALILFTIQPGGGAGPILGPAASASFNGSASISLYTDASGRAVGKGLAPNNHTGTYTITVTATVGAVTTFAVIHQHNVRGAPPPRNGPNNASGNGNGSGQTDATGQGIGNTTQGNGPHGHIAHGKLIKWALVGAAVVVTVVLVVVLTRGGGSTTVTAGPGTVGVP